VSELLSNSVLIKQLKEKRPDINPMHHVITMLGMVIFPFIVKPVLFTAGQANEKNFKILIKERKKLIPLWVKALLKAK